jgi:beta-N-acetylhexosaminidase
MLAFEGTRARLDLLTTLAEGGVPGVTLYPGINVETAAQLADLTASLQAAAGDLPLLIAADQETGQLVGLGPDTTQFPGAMALGAVGDADLARRVAAAVGREMRALGVTMNYAPVCDVVTNPANPSLGIRGFSDDPALVATLAAATVEGLASTGVAATAKHFPGKGEAVVDPHHELPVLEIDRERLDRVELAPFRAAISAGVKAVMTGHYAVPAVTGRRDLPGTVSEAMVRGVLRGDLGYDGVVITDALDMGALPQGVGQIVDVIASLLAGVDLLLLTPDPESQTRLRTGLDLAVSRGLLPPEVTAASRSRTSSLRSWLAGFEAPPFDVVGCAEHLDVAAEAARRAVTLVRNDAGVLPLDSAGRLLAVMPRPSDLTPADTSSSVTPSLAAALRGHHPDVTEIVTSHRPEPAEITSVLAAANTADVIVVGTLTSGVEQAAMVAGLLDLDVPVVTVAMRTPFDLAAYPAAPTHLCTYSIHRPSMDALCEVLFGVAPPLGRLPAAIPGLYPTGHRLDLG